MHYRCIVIINETIAPIVKPIDIEKIIIVAPIECSEVAMGQCIIANDDEKPLLVIMINIYNIDK